MFKKLALAAVAAAGVAAVRRRAGGAGGGGKGEADLWHEATSGSVSTPGAR